MHSSSVLAAKIRIKQAVGKIDLHCRKAVSRRPRLTALEEKLLHGLETDGAVMVHIDDFGFADRDAIVTAHRQVVDHLKQQSPRDQGRTYYVTAGKKEFFAHPETFLYPMRAPFLNVAHAYFGMPAIFKGISFRRDFPDGQIVETRKWHIDHGGSRILKLVYFPENVTEENGPFQYVPKKYTDRILPHYAPNVRVPAEFIDTVTAEQKKCVGPAGSILLVDTVSVYHRGFLPERERFASFVQFFPNCMLSRQWKSNIAVQHFKEYQFDLPEQYGQYFVPNP